MRAWEEKGREHLAGLADLLRAGDFGPEAMDLLNVAFAIAKTRFTAQISGSGSVSLPLDMVFRLNATPSGVEILAAE